MLNKFSQLQAPIFNIRKRTNVIIWLRTKLWFEKLDRVKKRFKSIIWSSIRLDIE